MFSFLKSVRASIRKHDSLVDPVNTLAAVYTWAAVTLVDVGGTNVVIVATWTVTLKAIDLVNAGASMTTGRRGTLVDVDLTETP